MRILVKGKTTAQQWKELSDIEEVQLLMEGSGHIDLRQRDSSSVSVTLSNHAKLQIE